MFKPSIIFISIFSLSFLNSQVDYKTQIQPIFNNKCISCHVQGSASAGLVLTSYSALMASQTVKVGDHQNSTLWKRINDGSMPPGPNDVTSSNVELVAKWINEGAKSASNLNNAPQAFDWITQPVDTINISKTNLEKAFLLDWTDSKDADGETISYLVSVSINSSSFEQIHETTSSKFEIDYQEFLDDAFDSNALKISTAQFSVTATDNKDTVKINGANRLVYINRSEYLSIDNSIYPRKFSLHENYPNPFNPVTRIRFDLPKIANVNLIIYNMLGQKVRTFNLSKLNAGFHSIAWDATNDYGDPVSAGVYLYQFQSKDFVKTRKMILVK